MNGLLRVVLVNGFVPAEGDSFKILTAAGNISGTFPVLSVPPVAGGKGLTWQVHYNPGDVTLEVLTVLLGDYNGNGIVDAADYVVWPKTSVRLVPSLAADGNGNNQIDTGDYDVWRAHFGQTAGSGAGIIANSAVPEPATLVLLILAPVGWYFHRRRTAEVVSTTHRVRYLNKPPLIRTLA